MATTNGTIVLHVHYMNLACPWPSALAFRVPVEMHVVEKDSHMVPGPEMFQIVDVGTHKGGLGNIDLGPSGLTDTRVTLND